MFIYFERNDSKMKQQLTISEKLKNKYHECEEVTNFKDMLYRSATIFKTRTAFKLKDENGKIYNKKYEEFKNDVEKVGTCLIEKGLMNKRIAVIGKNSYKWAVSYLAATIVGIVVPIDKELHSNDIINFMNVSKTECILGDSKNLKQIVEDIDKLENKNIFFISFDKENLNDKFLEFELELESGKNLLQEGNEKFREIKINPDELKILLLIHLDLFLFL